MIGIMGAILAPRWAASQGSEALTAAKLKEMVVAMGYEAKDLSTTPGKEKIEFKVTKSDLDIPIALEVSESKRYIWLTVLLNETTELPDLPARAVKLLSQNAAIQPCQFYITKSGKLMLGMAVENRSVDAPMLRRAVDFVGDNVGDTKDLWAK